MGSFYPRAQPVRITFEESRWSPPASRSRAGLGDLHDGAQLLINGRRPTTSSRAEVPLRPAENLGGAAGGPPSQFTEYRPYYQAVVKGRIGSERPMLEDIIMTMQNTTHQAVQGGLPRPRPQQNIIVKDKHYGDQVAVARDLAVAHQPGAPVAWATSAWSRCS